MPSFSSCVPNPQTLSRAFLLLCFCGASCSDDRAPPTAEPAFDAGAENPASDATSSDAPGVDAGSSRPRCVPDPCRGSPRGHCDLASGACVCDNRCPSEGSSECRDGELRTCQKDSAGCLDWSGSSSCASGFCADGATCGSCSIECSLAARECSGGSLRVCEVDERGCFVWSAPAACPGAECADSEQCGYHVGGIVSGLSGTVTLGLNGTAQPELSTNGSFSFSKLLLDKDAYAVSVVAQPVSQQCSVLNSAGRVAAANVSTIRVLCEGFPLSSFGAPVYFKASNPGRFDRFGDALAMSGNTLAVGAPFEDSTGTGPGARAPGAVYIFERGASGFGQQAFLKASNAIVADRFGWSLALNGDVLAVGAVGESSASRGINGAQGNTDAPNSGAVYVFVRQGQHWTQQAYIKASNADAQDRFGESVALSGMGRWFSDEDSEDVLVVGASAEGSSSRDVQSDNSLLGAGAAYVFVREGTAWRQAAYLKADKRTMYAQFGAAVAVSGDTVVVGEPQSSTAVGRGGAVHVFERSAGTWRESVRLEATHPGDADGFGEALALDGDLLAVGAQREDSAARGTEGDPSNDGAQESGAVYVFTRQKGGFKPTAYLKASNAADNHAFGTSVDLSGPLLVVGASGEAGASTGVDGNQADQSLPGSGAAYVFALEATGWVQRHYLKATNPDPGDFFGARVAVGAAGIAAGAPLEDSNSPGINGARGNDPLYDTGFDSGAVYVFPQ